MRDVDLKVLWPACVDRADDLVDAKVAFALHAYDDPAWLFLGKEAVAEFIDRLEPPKEKKWQDY